MPPSRDGTTYRWRIPWVDVNDEYKEKTTSEKFSIGKNHWMVLDLYANGVDDGHRDKVGVYARYVGRSRKVVAQVRLSVPGVGQWTSGPSLLGAKATASVRTRVGTPELTTVAELRAATEDDVTFVCEAAILQGHDDVMESSGDPKVTRGPSSEELLKRSSSLTQTYRNLRFTFGIAPIVLRYAMARQRAKGVRKRLKNIDEAAYYEERTLLWDDEHETEAPKIRELFERMGGLYNKLAQDWATRDGMLPQPWVRALKGSFEALDPRPWSRMKRCIYDGLDKEGVPPVRASEPRGSLTRYFASIETEPLAAASIGQVHLATVYNPRVMTTEEESATVIVKAIYPEIRRNLVADLANARRAAHRITWALKLPMKGSVDAIMDEQCDSFPRELDLRTEADNLTIATALFQKHQIQVEVPRTLIHLSSSSVLTQTFIKDAITLANLANVDPKSHPGLRERAVKDMITIAEAVGTTMFRDLWYHSDPHPGNCMVKIKGDDLTPALIDWGQCTRLTKDQLRTICHLVMLLSTKSPTLINIALQHTDFDFSTDDVEHRVALLYYLFDSTRHIEGVVSPEAMEYLVDAIRYTPKRMPVLTTVPREVVFYGRVVSTLRKSFDILSVNISVVDLWHKEARDALKILNAAEPQLTSTLLLLLPSSNPAGLIWLIEHTPDFIATFLDKLSRIAAKLAFDDTASVSSLFGGWLSSVEPPTQKKPRRFPVLVAFLLSAVAFLLLIRYILVGLAALTIFATVVYVAITRFVGPIPYLRLFEKASPSDTPSGAAAAEVSSSKGKT